MNAHKVDDLISSFAGSMTDAEHLAYHEGHVTSIDEVVATTAITGMHTGLIFALTDPTAARMLVRHMNATILDQPVDMIASPDDQKWIGPMLAAIYE